MKKYCTFLRPGTRSIFLKETAQSTVISILLPEYTLCWDYPIQTDHLLLLNMAIPVQHFAAKRERWDWVRKIPVLEGMPKTSPYWEKVLGRTVKEISL